MFAGPAIEERLEELGLSMDVQTHSRADGASQMIGAHEINADYRLDAMIKVDEGLCIVCGSYIRG